MSSTEIAPGLRTPLTFRAAVMTAPRAPLVVKTIQLDHLGPRDVLVRVRASGLCHTDLEVLDGTVGLPSPAVLGHEVAGVVCAVGAEVTTASLGDHVVCSAAPTCGVCFYCQNGQPVLCEPVNRTRADGTMPDGRTRLSSEGRPVHHLMHISGFAEYCVVPESGAVKISDAVPFDRACLIGCCVTTGVAATTRGVRVQPGSTVLVLGCGAVGLNAIQGARLAGAGTIIAVDTRAERLVTARIFGATEGLLTGDGLRSEVAALTSGRGSDYVFEAAGAASALRLAPELARPGGDLVFLGKVGADDEVTFRWGSLMGEKRLTRLAYGNARPAQDFPWFAHAYLAGVLELDALITSRIALDDINTGLDELRSGTSLRVVVEFD